MSNALLIRGGSLVDVEAGTVKPADLAIVGDRIAAVLPPGMPPPAGFPADATIREANGLFLAPGLIDAHLHIESSLLTPAEFARAALPHGTTGVFVDPHELANVAGGPGVDFFLAAAASLPLDMFVGIPSCVPATDFEEAGGSLGLADVQRYLPHPQVYGLAEMMNVPGIVHGFGDGRGKVSAALAAGKFVDGHCPGLGGAELATYVSNGGNDGVARITSDHESVTAAEVAAKIAAGMTIALRYGSATRDLDRILPELLRPNSAVPGAPSAVGEGWRELVCRLRGLMLCSDDLDPAELCSHGHVNRIVRRAAAILRADAGLSPETAAALALRLATLAPAQHYAPFFQLTGRPPRGRLAAGYLADLVAFTGIKHFEAAWVIKNGQLAAEHGTPVACGTSPTPAGAPTAATFHNSVHLARTVTPADFDIPAGFKEGFVNVRVIVVVPDSLLTQEKIVNLRVEHGMIRADPTRDILTLAVIERHHGTGHIGLGFVQGLGLLEGALASTVTHDSHNLIVAGTNAAFMAEAANRVASHGGGMLALSDTQRWDLPLPVAGLMADAPAATVAQAKVDLLAGAAQLGSPLRNPFMTLSFLALPVIPDLKLTTRGLFDVRAFKAVPLIVE